jgi:cytochrome c oxidase cbb3-type subunit 3
VSNRAKRHQYKPADARAFMDDEDEAQAMGIGERLFVNNCAQCHGSDGRGSKGFPNLTDRDWLYGGTPEVIKTTIMEGRNGVMPPMGVAVGGEDDVKNVANYVLSLSGSAHDSIRAAQGKAKFGACAACHGPEGKGNPAMGAPNLTDKIWLYGGTADIIAETYDVPRETITPDSHVIDDLGIDSLDFLDIVFAIDKAFGIKVPIESWTQEVNAGNEPAEKFFVMKNLATRIEELVAAKSV